jgi:hypothetical protein
VLSLEGSANTFVMGPGNLPLSLLRHSKPEAADLVITDELDSGFFERRLNSDYRRNVAAHCLLALLDPPTRGRPPFSLMNTAHCVRGNVQDFTGGFKSFSSSGVLFSKSDTNPARFVLLGKLNSGFLKGCLDPKHGRDVAHNGTGLGFNPPDGCDADISGPGEIVLTPIQ